MTGQLVYLLCYVDFVYLNVGWDFNKHISIYLLHATVSRYIIILNLAPNTWITAVSNLTRWYVFDDRLQTLISERVIDYTDMNMDEDRPTLLSLHLLSGLIQSAWPSEVNAWQPADWHCSVGTVRVSNVLLIDSMLDRRASLTAGAALHRENVSITYLASYSRGTPTSR